MSAFVDEYSRCQFEQYNGITATSAKSSATATTAIHRAAHPAGAEEDKLGKIANLAPADADTTALNFAQAEPGHNIFAGKEEEKPKSEAVPKAQIPVAPVVPIQGNAEASEVHSSVQDERETLQESSQAGTTSVNSDSTTLESNIPPTSSSSADGERTQAQGPVEEAEAEADRARQELFPDENV